MKYKEATAKIILKQVADGLHPDIPDLLGDLCAPASQAQPGDIIGHVLWLHRDEARIYYNNTPVIKDEYAVVKTEAGIAFRTAVEMMQDPTFDREALRLFAEVTMLRREARDTPVEKAMTGHAQSRYVVSRGPGQRHNLGAFSVLTPFGALSLRRGFGDTDDNMFRGSPAIQCNQRGVDFLVKAIIPPNRTAHEAISSIENITELDTIWHYYLDHIVPNRKSLKLVPMVIA